MPRPLNCVSSRRLRCGPPAADDDDPVLVVAATPPDVVADVVERSCAPTRAPSSPTSASVKLEPPDALQARGVDLTHYIGSHPLAGRDGRRLPRRAPTSSDGRGSWPRRRPRRPTSRSSKGSRSISARRRSR
ncbi:MAG: hypothetical protein R2692_07800 [Microbacterium sp.]